MNVRLYPERWGNMTIRMAGKAKGPRIGKLQGRACRRVSHRRAGLLRWRKEHSILCQASS